jgi:hypothetical protein
VTKENKGWKNYMLLILLHESKWRRRHRERGGKRKWLLCACMQLKEWIKGAHISEMGREK